jgi:purine-binding chemotaxis protein CheW
MAEPVFYASCTVGDLLIGIDASAVQEVTAGAALTPVPLSSPLVSGLLNLRGQIVTVIDLRRCLRMHDRPAGLRPLHVILQTGDGGVSLVVDEVGDVIALQPETVQAPPQSLPTHLRSLVGGAYERDGTHLLTLDVDRVLNLAGRERASIGG